MEYKNVVKMVKTLHKSFVFEFICHKNQVFATKINVRDKKESFLQTIAKTILRR